MFKLKIEGLKEERYNEIIHFFFGDLIWTFDREEKVATAEGNYKIIAKVIFYLITRVNPFTRIAFTIVRISDEERHRKEDEPEEINELNEEE